MGVSMVVTGAELQLLQNEINDAFTQDRKRLKALEQKIAELTGEPAEEEAKPDVVVDETPEEDKIPVNPEWEQDSEDSEDEPVFSIA